LPEIAHCDTDDMQNATNLIDTVNWQYWSVTWSSTSERQTIITIIIHTFLHIHGSRVVTSKATTHDSIEMCKLLLLWQTTTKSIYVNAIHQKTLKVTARDLARHKRVYNSAKMINWSTEQPCTITAYHNNVEHRPPQRRIPNNCNLVIPSEYSHLHANILTHTWIFLFSSSSCKRNTKPWHQTSMTDYQITHGLRHWTQTKAEYPAVSDVQPTASRHWRTEYISLQIRKNTVLWSITLNSDTDNMQSCQQRQMYWSATSQSISLMYQSTPWAMKKRATLFSIITPAFLGRFL